MNALVNETSGESVSLKQLLAIVERRSFGAVILLLGFIAISPLTIVPGATWLIAAVTALFATQLLFGSRQPWLPPRLVKIGFPRKMLLAMVQGSREVAHIADKLTAPRLEFLTRFPFVMAPAIAAIAAAVVTFPLGFVPLAPMLPGLTLVLIGVGLTAKDGVFLLLALLTLAGSGMLLWRVLPNVF